MVDSMKVVEFRHIAPFDGCCWRWEYVAFRDPAEPLPIVWTQTHWFSMGDVVNAALAGKRTAGEGFVKSITLFDWYDEYFYAMIPAGYFPAFAVFAAKYDLEFEWQCKGCGEFFRDVPVHMADYSGIGGTHVEVWSWLCAGCATEEEAG